MIAMRAARSLLAERRMRVTISHRHSGLFAGAALVAVLGLGVMSVPAAAQSLASPPSSSDDPFARHTWHLEIESEIASEAWNYNGSREVIYGLEPGFAYGLHKGLIFRAAFPVRYISQRGTDALQLGATFGLRGRFLG